jgi:hypothetical protein
MSENNDTTRARLDAHTLDQRAEHLPESMRELFVWLGCYCREECGRDIDILADKFKAINIHHDKTTWSRILRGMWQQDAHGNKTASPCLAEDKFIKAVTALRNDTRIKELGGRVPFVKTPTSQDIWHYIDKKRAPDRINKFGLIIGETGTQKGASMREYCRLNNHGICGLIEAAESPSMNQFMDDLIAIYTNSSQGGMMRKKAYIRRVVNHKRTIMLENIQRLYDPRAGDKQPVFSFLQKLQEDTGCTIILSLTPTFEQTLLGGAARMFFEQFEGRAGGRRTFLRLPPFPPEEDVVMIAQAFGLLDVKKYSSELVAIAHEEGRIRRLFEVLQDAKIEAESLKSKLTIDHVREACGV